MVYEDKTEGRGQGKATNKMDRVGEIECYKGTRKRLYILAQTNILMFL